MLAGGLPAPGQALGYCSFYLEWVSALVIVTGVVSAWRGAWLVLDVQLWPERPTESAALGFGVGAVLFALLGLAQPWLAAAAGRAEKKCLFWALDALYSYLGLWCCVLVWRGVWQLWDGALGFALPATERQEVDSGFVRGAWLSHAAGVVLALLLGAMRSLNAPPMLILTDNLSPLFGARATSGLSGLRPLQRCNGELPLLPAAEWYEAVGLPYMPGGAAAPDASAPRCANEASPSAAAKPSEISNL